MPVGYKLITFLVALIGDGSLVVTGEVNPLFFLPAALVFVGYLRAIRNRPQANRYIIGAGSTVVLFVFLFDAFVLSADVIVAVAHLSILFQALKSFDIKEPWDPLQVFFMAMIQLLLASELTRSMMFGVFFVVFIVLMVFAVFYSHLIKEGQRNLRTFIKPISMLSVVVFTLTVVIFILTPRLQGSLWGKGLSRGMKSGFSENIKLGGLGEIKLDPTVVMRVRITPRPETIPYWRGITYDLYQDGEWISLFRPELTVYGSSGVFFIGSKGSNTTVYKQDIILEPLDTDVTFLIRNPVEFRADIQSIKTDNSHTVYVSEKKNKRFHYVVTSTDEPLPLNEWSAVYLKVPDDMKKLKLLSLSLTKNIKNVKEKIQVLMNYLKNNYSYSLKVSTTRGVNPVEDFLFRTKQGYCEHFASALTLMLRAAGVPSRVVSGYLGGEYNRYGKYYIVRQKDAHTWVEALVGDRWIRLDPTPSVPSTVPSRFILYVDYLKLRWERYVVQFSRYDQIRLFKAFSSPLSLHWIRSQGVRSGVLAFLLFFSFALIFMIYIRRSKSQKVNLSGRLFLKLKRILGIKENLTPLEVSEVVRQTEPQLKKPVEEFIEFYIKSRFSRTPPKNSTYQMKTLIKRIKEKKK